MKDVSKIGMKNKICINVFCCENKLTYPIYVSDQKIENLTRGFEHQQNCKPFHS